MPPFREDVKTCFRDHNRMREVLSEIALGRPDNGRALGGETARQKARDVLIELNIKWPGRPKESER